MFSEPVLEAQGLGPVPSRDGPVQNYELSDDDDYEEYYDEVAKTKYGANEM